MAYYAQAVDGQIRLMAATRPIHELIVDDATVPELRRQLLQTTAIRDFASRELDLPDNASYRSYADLGRPYAVWNVFAAPEFSLEPQQWCFALVGCINYRGYYDKNDAEHFAEELSQAGLDTYVRGVPAYSTLGYFSDPMLNTILRFGDQEVARIIFHELAHQLVYAEGDSTFNESFATAVENEGMRRWLARSTPLQRRSFGAQQERKAQFHRLLGDTRDKLRAIYASSLEPVAMRNAKSLVIAEMQQTYAALKTGWGGYSGYDQWFSQSLNNAALGSIAIYTQWVPGFELLLEQEGRNLPRFYRRVAALAKLTKSERSAIFGLLLSNRMANIVQSPKWLNPLK